MTSLYAKIRKVLPVFLLAALLAACSGPAGNLPVNTGVVTNDPSKLPDISWQTQTDRNTLTRASEQFAKEQAAPAVSAPAAAAHKSVVALLLPLTGKGAELGQGMLKAAQMALFDVGSSNIQLEPRDTKSTPAGAAAAAAAAMAGHADLILGPVYADDLKAVKPVVNGTPVIAFTTDWNQAGGNTYVMGFLPFAQVARVAQYAQAHGYARLAVFAPQTEYCNSVIATLQRTGISTVRTDRYEPQQSDLAAIVKDFVATSKAPGGGLTYDSLMLPMGGEGLRTVVSLLDAEGGGKNVRLLGTGLWDDPTLSTYSAIIGGWYAAPDPRLRADFEKRYLENYGAAPPRLASLAYDATALAAVLGRPGGTSGGNYGRDSLTNPRGFAGIDGIFRFRADGLAERGLAILEITNAKPKLVDPAPTAFLASGS